VEHFLEATKLQGACLALQTRLDLGQFLLRKFTAVVAGLGESLGFWRCGGKEKESFR
jgi:hypothetical protein